MRIVPGGDLPSSYTLRIVASANLQAYGYTGEVEHHIPLVADIVPQIDPQRKQLFVNPPEGNVRALGTACGMFAVQTPFTPCSDVLVIMFLLGPSS